MLALSSNVVDPYGFGPPGSKSVVLCPDPDPSIIKQKMFPYYYFVTSLLLFLSLKTDKMYHTFKKEKAKNL
jgi:hypothetical protein